MNTSIARLDDKLNAVLVAAALALLVVANVGEVHPAQWLARAEAAVQFAAAPVVNAPYVLASR